MTREERKAYMKEYNKKYYEDNKKYYDEYYKKRRQTEEYKAYIDEYNKKYYEANKEEIIERKKQYNEANKDIIKERKKKYRKANRKKIREYENRYISERFKKDSLFRLRCNIRNMIKKTIRNKGLIKSAKTEQILGCTIEEFIKYMQSKFQEGMTIENHRTMAHRPYNTHIKCKNRRRSN